ncbi:hypothetical protein [Anatilimnocola floriformis]|uniref:hypothetical protein n=1 Tax=Anatilimnocola floriformis TaxID=2948575 RepID=UPI0020C4CF67|nr:hypothetical protein [Anatilimnocola floriformis]
MNFSLQRLFLLVTTVAVFLWLYLGFHRVLTRVEYGESRPSVPWLPAAAKNVSYYKSYAFTAYEFEIPEDDFVKWSGEKLTTINRPVRVPRYCLIRMPLPDLMPNPTLRQEREQIRTLATRETLVSQGLAYDHHRDSGGGTIVAYDRQRGKGYFWHAPY